MKTPRPRHYVSAPVLTVMRPLFRYSARRDAFVLRIAHGETGPVLKRERRRHEDPHTGPWIDRGELRAVRLGSPLVRVRSSGLDRFIAERSVAQVPDETAAREDL
jgi:hypothetical protein